MSRRVLCKFYMHGACLKGEYCEFSHDRTDPPNNICTFYQRGVCSYGARCRYDHVKPSHSQPITPPLPVQSNTRPSASYPSLSPPSSHSPVKPTWSTESHILSEEPTGSIPVNPEEMPICSFAAAGLCPYGETCMQMHGDTCPICGKQCLHPYRPEEREEHLRFCQRNNRRLEALRKSQDIECSVCLEKVLSKPTAAERKFGLLSECDHPFCVSCIRNWRSNSLHDSGIDVNQAVRACPICRRLSYYVIPSILWYFSKEEKDEIMDSYKAKLKSIDCKYFDFGNGSCPFGTSCFYKHAYRDGSLEEIKLRHVDADEGSTVIVKMIRFYHPSSPSLSPLWLMSYFLTNSTAVLDMHTKNLELLCKRVFSPKLQITGRIFLMKYPHYRCVFCAKKQRKGTFEYLIEVWEGGGKVVRDIFSHRGYVQKKFQIFICKCEFPLGYVLITLKGKQEAVQ